MKKSQVTRCFTDILLFEASQVILVLAAKGVDELLLRQQGVLFRLCDSGVASIVAGLAAICFLVLRLHPEDRKLLRQHKRKMQTGELTGIASVFCIIQLSYAPLVSVFETVLKHFGWSAMPQVPQEIAPLLLLYTCTLAPVVEELFFRGAALRLQSKGKAVAIAVTSMLFGLAHGTLYQAVYAGFCGLILGWIAVEYSLKWSIVFHVFNNAVLGCALPVLLMPETWGTVLYVGIFAAALLLSGRWLVPRRSRIRTALHSCMDWQRWKRAGKRVVPALLRHRALMALLIWNALLIATSFTRL